MPIKMTGPDGAKVIINTLRDLTDRVNPKFSFCLAAKTAFVFVGTAEEFKQDIDLLDRLYQGKNKDYVPLMDRKVTGYRKRDVPGEAKHMILIEGGESGPFWLRCEYETFHRNGGAVLPTGKTRKRTPRKAGGSP